MFSYIRISSLRSFTTNIHASGFLIHPLSVGECYLNKHLSMMESHLKDVPYLLIFDGHVSSFLFF